MQLRVHSLTSGNENADRAVSHGLNPSRRKEVGIWLQSDICKQLYTLEFPSWARHMFKNTPEFLLFFFYIWGSQHRRWQAMMVKAVPFFYDATLILPAGAAGNVETLLA